MKRQVGEKDSNQNQADFIPFWVECELQSQVGLESLASTELLFVF